MTHCLRAVRNNLMFAFWSFRQSFYTGTGQLEFSNPIFGDNGCVIATVNWNVRNPPFIHLPLKLTTMFALLRWAQSSRRYTSLRLPAGEESPIIPSSGGLREGQQPDHTNSGQITSHISSLRAGIRVPASEISL